MPPLPHIPPKILFIVPFRDRDTQLSFFRRHMKYILEDETEPYRILVVHQKDNRPFNRGAMKNIGANFARTNWPDAYNNMTLVFNDVDTVPIEKGLFDYKTTPGIVKHFYGFRNTLGGIVSICGIDFDRCSGFPNLWAWGFEDNAFQSRCLAVGLTIKRDPFYPILSKHIIQIPDGQTRRVNRAEYNTVNDSRADSLRDLINISTNLIEYKETNTHAEIFQLDVHKFQGKFPPPSPESFETHSLHKGGNVFGSSRPNIRRLQFL